jgi:hypothetical protein
MAQRKDQSLKLPVVSGCEAASRFSLLIPVKNEPVEGRNLQVMLGEVWFGAEPAALN